jgi:hypothetical protein
MALVAMAPLETAAAAAPGATSIMSQPMSMPAPSVAANVADTLDV